MSIEQEKEFVARIKKYVDEWNMIEHKTKHEALNGLAFSILSLLDGEDGSHPPCIVRPLVSSPDGNEWLDSGEDITGSLHNMYYD